MNAPVSDRLLVLQRRFVDGLERRLDAMTAALEGGADPAALMPMFHSLAGIGGTYGFPRITEISRRCEQLCVMAITHTRALAALEIECLTGAVANIRAAGPHRRETTHD